MTEAQIITLLADLRVRVAELERLMGTRNPPVQVSQDEAPRIGGEG